MARRLVERGVRFVQIFIEFQIWDAHSDLENSLRYSAGKTDQPAAALVKDLKRRGLLDSTLVIWGGEFGRMPIGQGRTASAGRDHGPSGFSMWMAGGGVKRGYVHGATDDLGHKSVQDRVSVHDFHATLLHLLGMNYRDLVYERNGLKERITDQIPARVVSEILA
jgi:arylsulfatase A-like enzyme